MCQEPANTICWVGTEAAPSPFLAPESTWVPQPGVHLQGAPLCPSETRASQPSVPISEWRGQSHRGALNCQALGLAPVTLLPLALSWSFLLFACLSVCLSVFWAHSGDVIPHHFRKSFWISTTLVTAWEKYWVVTITERSIQMSFLPLQF